MALEVEIEVGVEVIITDVRVLVHVVSDDGLFDPMCRCGGRRSTHAPCIGRGQCSTSTTDVQLLGVVVAKIAFIGGDIVDSTPFKEEFNTRGGARFGQGNVAPDIVLRSDTGVDQFPVCHAVPSPRM